MNARVVAGVIAGWLLVGVVWAAQNSIGAGLQGRSLPIGTALRPALVQSLPWIPVTLAVISISIRWPLAWPPRVGRVAIHAVAALAVAYAANVLVVLGFWLLAGRFDGYAPLLTSAGRWTLIRLHIALLIYCAIAGVVHWVRYHRSAQDRELQLARVEGQLARARLDALTAQIRPHFLLNTLHTMGQLWRSGRSDAADAVLDHLGRLFHKVRDSTTRTEIRLAEEVDMVRDYLAIEQTRFGDRMRAAVQVDNDALDCLVPPLILQPLVENAVRHGISATSTAGHLDVRATVNGGALIITVKDDGPGVNSPTRTPGSGTGLRNTRERLAQLYGAAGSLEILGATERGTTVEVRLPARRAAEQEAARG